MKSSYLKITFLGICMLLVGCTQVLHTSETKEKIKIGVLLADDGLGDHSFNDTAFLGLMKARDELGIMFDYRDLSISSSFKDGLLELVEGQYDLIIGLGYPMKENFEAVALEYPNQSFLYLDETIDLPNVTSITFNEYEGSYLAGIIAGLKTESNSIGFLGGVDAPVINRFKDGFISGVTAVNPNAKIYIEYAATFGDPEIGRKMVSIMVEEKDVDIVFPAAGYTGLGALEEAVAKKIFAIGVDTDQFYLAEKAVITSMLKNVDVAIYTAIKELVETGSLSKKHIELSLVDNGVGISQIRLVSLSEREKEQINALTGQLIYSTED
ncbi:BMP family ABC transporter substrate-binding protein [Alkalihalobacillus deserti]|uniref:BMP family ABC transporter substrate-binding protein n=1 Tax=Alkalihalobacillus deserti TaxID=2879466 RepID=UPI001D13ADDD|nr:BMP family ABC transporter substrate-binding protein [Alkalihalobacillus deserti]